MPPDRLVSYVVSIVCDEQHQAQKGEVAVMVGDSAVWTGRMGAEELGGHISAAALLLAQRAKEALDANEATKDEPPPSEPRRAGRRRQEPQENATRSSGVSRSRLR